MFELVVGVLISVIGYVWIRVLLLGLIYVFDCRSSFGGGFSGAEIGTSDVQCFGSETGDVVYPYGGATAFEPIKQGVFETHDRLYSDARKSEIRGSEAGECCATGMTVAERLKLLRSEPDYQDISDLRGGPLNGLVIVNRRKVSEAVLIVGENEVSLYSEDGFWLVYQGFLSLDRFALIKARFRSGHFDDHGVKLEFYYESELKAASAEGSE